jgi:hypothetical protein
MVYPDLCRRWAHREVESGHLAVPGCSPAPARAFPGAVQQSLALAGVI